MSKICLFRAKTLSAKWQKSSLKGSARKSFSPLQPYFSWVLFSNCRSIRIKPKPGDSTVHCPTVTCWLAPFHAPKSGINSRFLHFWGSTSTGALASPAKQSSIYQRCHEGSQSSIKIFSPFKIFSLHHIYTFLASWSFLTQLKSCPHN